MKAGVQLSLSSRWFQAFASFIQATWCFSKTICDVSAETASLLVDVAPLTSDITAAKPMRTFKVLRGLKNGNFNTNVHFHDNWATAFAEEDPVV